MVNAFSFACSACGKCCNSPPAMSLRELFRHRDLFVGCIAIGRISRVQADDALAAALFFPAGDRSGDFLSITAQGYDYPSAGRCPALDSAGLCSIHANGKPDMCDAVPLDPLVPDSLQHRVLATRARGAGYIGADCIVPGTHADAALLVAEGRIVDASARAAVERRRTAIATERELWGRAVFDSLRASSTQGKEALARIPPGGYATISIVPALLAVAGLSAACRELCVAYIASQMALIERNVAQAIARRHLNDRPVTQELRGFLASHVRAREVLLESPAAPPVLSDRLRPIADDYFSGP
ncbi:flagellin N-methylase [Caballeronia arationis]|jgi:Fe-S-cluster containining protein|uniref:Zinc- or iron-chelating domain-containing protein n=1 Tax=Caballeronia arationis TaxID=1777142 RepID=A0A7Z7I2B9_9BURK|nr:zinc/iron-chelating domain-containing protein [Caballeronia arationis]SAL00601.1 flagellin N-methylase [Caballeronia arationis]SOE53119.1 Putative zinc- or iron-chelating domain-containing protein [Caballeronia arationis]